MNGDTSLRWWQKTIAYEIYVNSFRDSDGDGYGDLNGIRSQLDHLKELKVGAIWLTPVYASPMVDNGYDVADYYSINPRYGTMEEMEALIKEAGDRGIKIVMDLVFNHTSDKCVWFTDSEKSAGNEYSDWYIWKDANPDGSAPNNWRSIFGGSAWEWSESRQQYYLHTFAKEQPDLNWENPKVREELYNVALFWLDKGVAGFRFDVFNLYSKAQPLRSDRNPFRLQKGTNFFVDGPRMHEFLQELNTGVFLGVRAEAGGTMACKVRLEAFGQEIVDVGAVLLKRVAHLVKDVKT